MNKILRRMSIRFIPMEIRIQLISFKVKLYIEYLRLRGKTNKEILDILNADFERKIEGIRNRI